MKPLVVHRRIAIEELEWFKTKPWHLTDQLTLKQFLEQESTKAGVFDSHGEFSVSLEDAMDKMLKHRYPEPECFVLRLLQSAAVVGAREALVVSGSNKDFLISFKVDEPGRYGELSTVADGLTRMNHSGDADGFLLSGLQAAIPLVADGVEWSQLRGERKDILTWSSDGCTISRTYKAHAPQKESKFRLLGVGPERKRKNFWRRFFEFMGTPPPGVFDHSKLSQRLFAYPFDVCLYGFRFGVGRVQDVQYTPSAHLPRLSHLKSSPPSLVRLGPKKIMDVGIVVPRFPEDQVVLDQKGQLIEQVVKPTLRASCFVRTALSQESPCRLHWVEAGVVLETEEFESDDFVFEAWVSVFGLKTDLSGFKVVRDRAHSERIDDIKSMVRTHLAAPAKEWLAAAESGYRDSDLL